MGLARYTLFSTLARFFLNLGVQAYTNSRSDNLVVYWGQNSYGATNPSDTANWQKPIGAYCDDNTIDALPMAFVDIFFGPGSLPSLNLANTCNPTDNTTFSGSSLPDCSTLASGIKACQAKGKIVTISLGGATGAIGFTSDSQASDFADQVWNLFLGGSSKSRPFGDAVLDGIDLDIEGGSTTGYTAFVKQIRTHTNNASKTYYVTGAPQCPFPDAYLGSTINTVGFDALYVQFYNNYCGLTDYSNPNAWDFASWDNWAQNTSPNKNVKIFIGAPASKSAAGSGYIDAATLGSIASATKAKYSSFGGVMLWDASQAAANSNYAQSIKGSLTAPSAAIHHSSAKPSSTVEESSMVRTSTRSTASLATQQTTYMTSNASSTLEQSGTAIRKPVVTSIASALPSERPAKQSRFFKFQI